MTSFYSLIQISIITVLMSVPALGQSVRVKQVKGSKALVEVIEGGVVKGQVLSGTQRKIASESKGSRDHFLGLSGGVTTSKVGNESVTGIALDILYGWNHKTIEYGVLGSVGLSSGGGQNTSTFGVGGKFDYNFSENIETATSLMAIGIDGQYKMSSSSGTSTSAITLFPALSWKWFALGNATCIRFDLGGSYTQNMSNSSGSSSKSEFNPALRFGLQTYF